jgi:hypothetical protein
VRFPDVRTSIACLCNLGTANPSALADQVAEIVIGSAFRAPAVAANGSATPPGVPPATPASYKANAAELAAVAGTYYAQELDAVFVVEPDSTGIRLRFQGGNSQVLPATGPRTYGRRGFSVEFPEVSRGAPARMVVNAGRVRGIVAERRR